MNTDRLKDVRDAHVRAAAVAERAARHAHQAWMPGRDELTVLEALVAAGASPTGTGSNQPLLVMLVEMQRAANDRSRERYIQSSNETTRLKELSQLLGLVPLPARRPQ